MPTMLDASARGAILSRLDALRPESTPRWGKMNVSQMLAHIGDAMRMAMGDLVVKPKTSPILRLLPIKKLVIYLLPFPRNVPTAEELCARVPHSFERELADVKALIVRLDPASGAKRADAHPIFGPLSSEDWGQLGYNHLDHHLRQFGV